MLTAKQRLAQSRSALMAAMGARRVDDGISPLDASPALGQGGQPPTPSLWSGARLERSVIGLWWRHSHLSTALDLARPFLQDYASKHPAKLMAFAAGAGSLLVVVRPWRLLSLGMAMSLVVRNTNLKAILADVPPPSLGETEIETGALALGS